MKMAILLASVMLNAWLGYRVLDLGVTTTYQSDQIRYLHSQLTDVEKLWTKLIEKKSRAALIETANQVGLDVIDKKSEGAMYVGRVKFILSGDGISKIVLSE